MAQSQINIHLLPQEPITCPNNLQAVLSLPNENAWMGASVNDLVKFNPTQIQETYLSVFENCSSIDLLKQHIYVGSNVFSLSDNDFLELPIFEQLSLHFDGSFNVGIKYSQWILPQEQLLLHAHYTGPDRTIGIEDSYSDYLHQILLFDLASNSIIKQIAKSNEPYQTVAANAEFVVASTLEETSLWKHNGDLLLENSSSFNHIIIHPQLPLFVAIDTQDKLQLLAYTNEQLIALPLDHSEEIQNMLFHPTLALLFVLDSKSVLSIYDCSSNTPKVILQRELNQNSKLLNINTNKIYTLCDSNQLLIFDIQID